MDDDIDIINYRIKLGIYQKWNQLNKVKWFDQILEQMELIAHYRFKIEQLINTDQISLLIPEIIIPEKKIYDLIEPFQYKTVACEISYIGVSEISQVVKYHSAVIRLIDYLSHNQYNSALQDILDQFDIEHNSLKVYIKFMQPTKIQSKSNFLIKTWKSLKKLIF